MKIDINRRALTVYIVLLLIFVLLVLANSFSYMRSSMSDKLYGDQQSLDNIVIVEINDESINKIGRWPWDRNVFSDILLELKEAKVIGIDVSFFEESEDDSELIKTLEEFDNIVLAAEINQNTLYTPIFDNDVGYVNLLTDSDGITRSLQVGLNPEVTPFAFKVYEKSYSTKRKFSNKNYFINYVSEPGSFSSIGAYEVLQKDHEIDFKDKIVLIGATAPNLHDNYFVPTSDGMAMPGVEIHATIIQNAILNNFLSKQGKFSILLLTIISSIAGFFYFSKLKIYYTIPAILLAILFYSFFGAFLFNNSNYLLDLFFVPISLLIFTGSGIAINYIEEKKHSGFLKEAFGRYVSKDLLSEIIDKKQQLKLGGAKRNITVFFSDIRGFTSISEGLSPEDLVTLINEYLTEMTGIILEHRGTVDKFIGDAIMAFWNAPFLEKDHPKLACQSAIAQIRALEKLQKSLEARKLPKINIGCGIHTGDAIIGNMGSEDRFDYTAMGDTVNLSSRLEGLTKQYGVSIIISEVTYNLVKNDFCCRKLDAVKVKGKKIPIKIYELCLEGADVNKKFIEQYEKALELYFKSKFKQAKEEFEKASKMSNKDVSSRLFIDRCKEYLKNPPANDWDGSFEMKTK